MDADRWTPTEEMAWLLRYLSPDLKVSASAHYRKSEIARHAADGFPAMNSKGIYDYVVGFLQAKKPPDVPRLRLHFITGKQASARGRRRCRTFKCSLLLVDCGRPVSVRHSGPTPRKTQVLDNHRRSQPATLSTLVTIRDMAIQLEANWTYDQEQLLEA
eukprot:scaffold137375_cov28-Prasinocladus_malaysianus.AAC.1